MPKQLLPIHQAAYMLIPANRGSILTPHFQKQLDDFIIERCSIEGYSQWIDYIGLEGQFNVQKPCWTEFADNPKLFWSL